jgi:hypothetical protein
MFGDTRQKPHGRDAEETTSNEFKFIQVDNFEDLDGHGQSIMNDENIHLAVLQLPNASGDC